MCALEDRLDPVTHLPEREDVGVSREAYGLARETLDAIGMREEWQHIPRSGIAAAAVWLSSAVVDGDGRVSQQQAATASGVSARSLRTHIVGVAEEMLGVDVESFGGDEEEVRAVVREGAVRGVLF